MKKLNKAIGKAKVKTYFDLRFVTAPQIALQRLSVVPLVFVISRVPYKKRLQGNKQKYLRRSLIRNFLTMYSCS